MNRSVLVLLDFSKTYDTVWREKLLTSMFNNNVQHNNNNSTDGLKKGNNDSGWIVPIFILFKTIDLLFSRSK